MHGGRMWLESPSPHQNSGPGGAGTAFYFSLPLRTPAAAPLDVNSVTRWFNPYGEYEYRQRNRRSVAPAPETRDRYVLLENGEALQRLFQRYWDDAEVVTVADKQAALAELSRAPAQALIVNAASFDAPPLSPSQLADLPYETPAITCWVPGEDSVNRRMGIVRYLVKPVTREALLTTLDELGEEVSSVLLVDDEPEALQLFTRMLTSIPQRYQVIQARNGLRGLDLLRQRRPDVLLLDLVMPGLNGFQLLQQKALDPATREIPTIVISSLDPANEPIVSDALSVRRGEGLSVSNLLACIQAFSEILNPSAQAVRRAPPGTLGESPAC
jgi:CheY-like chemotaxis protein